MMSESVDKFELEAHYLYENTPSKNRKLRSLLYPTEVYDAFVNLTEKGAKRPATVCASMLRYIEKIETNGFREPAGEVELKPYILHNKNKNKKRISVCIPVELLERFEGLDVPTNNTLTYTLAMYDYLLSKGEM